MASWSRLSLTTMSRKTIRRREAGSSAVANPALRSYTAQEVRDEYMCVPDAATLAAPGTPESPGYGLRSEDAVYEDVPEAPARRRR